MPHEKDAPQPFPIAFGDPATLKPSIVVGDEIRSQIGHKRLKVLVPAVLFCIQLSVSADHPAHIAGPILAQNIGRWGTVSRHRIHDAGHGTEKSAALLWSKAFEKQFSLLIGTLVQFIEERPPFCGQPEFHLAGVACGHRLSIQSGVLKSAQDAAQIAPIKIQLICNLSRQGPVMHREFVQHAGFGQRVLAVEKSLTEGADWAFATEPRFLVKPFRILAGTTGLEPATSGVTAERKLVSYWNQGERMAPFSALRNPW